MIRGVVKLGAGVGGRCTVVLVLGLVGLVGGAAPLVRRAALGVARLRAASPRRWAALLLCAMGTLETDERGAECARHRSKAADRGSGGAAVEGVSGHGAARGCVARDMKRRALRAMCWMATALESPPPRPLLGGGGEGRPA